MGRASLRLPVSRGECEAGVLQESILLAVYTGSLALRLTTVKWPVLSSLSAMCILQLTTQKAGVGSRTAISSWRVGSIDTFTLGNKVRIFSVWARLHCMNISLIKKRNDDCVQDEAWLGGERTKRGNISFGGNCFIHFSLIFLKVGLLPLLVIYPMWSQWESVLPSFPLFPHMLCALHSYGCNSCAQTVFLLQRRGITL